MQIDHSRCRRNRTSLSRSISFNCFCLIALSFVNFVYFFSIEMSSARAVYRQYSSSSNLSSSENLPPRTLARLAREVRDLHKNPPEGVRLVIDDETGLPSNLGELMVSIQRCICRLHLFTASSTWYFRCNALRIL